MAEDGRGRKWVGVLRCGHLLCPVLARAKGKYLVRICDGTACHVKGSMPIYNAVKKRLDLRDGRVTTADGLFTLETVACVGARGIAPVMVVMIFDYQARPRGMW